ncbi:MAG: hypothetical protein ACF8SC_08980 [Phycisphaerales bacterium JB037]
MGHLERKMWDGAMTGNRRIGARRVLGGAALLGWLAVMGGCQRVLFTSETGRTPFDQHDLQQGRYVEPYVFDAFGSRRPNLNGRLAPKN